MKRQLTVIGITGALMMACTSEENEVVVPLEEVEPVVIENEVGEPAPVLLEKRIAVGVLEHFPQDVKSVEAFLGHEFKVGDTPITPTAAVSVADLKKLIGQRVKAEGNWNPGKVEEPTGEALLVSRPQGFESEPKGSGLEVLSVTKAK